MDAAEGATVLIEQTLGRQLGRSDRTRGPLTLTRRCSVSHGSKTAVRWLEHRITRLLPTFSDTKQTDCAARQCRSKVGRGVPSTAIAPTTSSQNGSTPKPGIASRASPGNSSHCRPSTMNSSRAVPRSTIHTIGGKGVAKAPMASEMPAMTKARASRFVENLRASKSASLRWSTVCLVPRRWRHLVCQP